MDYKLFHYKIDNFDDCGFGCSYRNIQTILSAYLLNNENKFEIPSIQSILYYFFPNYKNMSKKKLWIEPVQVSKYLKEMYDLNTLNILYIINDADIENMLNTDVKYYIEKNTIYNSNDFNDLLNILLLHFKNSILPVIIDDGIYSYCLLNIDINNNTINIADPHTVNSNNVLKNKDIKFLQDKFWMICIPLEK